jgi:GH25 family lysozyme M1 (1,4-beta-N-acetylmuramidase)
MTTPPVVRLFDPHSAVVASAQGLDVSNFQGNFGWSAVKAGYPSLAFGIYKMTEGTTFTDPFARHNHDGIAGAALRHGAYHFLRPGSDGTAQAQFFVAQHRKIGLTADDMLWLDNEVADGKTPGQVAACARAFMTELDRICPHNPKGVYTMVSFATGGENAGLGKWPLWLAHPSSTAPVPPPPWARWSFWQWGTRNGIDADAFNGTASQLATWLASFGPQVTAGPRKHLTKAGDTLNGIARPRHITGVQLLNTSAKNWTAADRELIASLELPADMPYYTLH